LRCRGVPNQAPWGQTLSHSMPLTVLTGMLHGSSVEIRPSTHLHALTCDADIMCICAREQKCLVQLYFTPNDDLGPVKKKDDDLDGAP
jgi:hypothetical protein